MCARLFLYTVEEVHTYIEKKKILQICSVLCNEPNFFLLGLIMAFSISRLLLKFLLRFNVLICFTGSGGFSMGSGPSTPQRSRTLQTRRRRI